MNKTRRLTALAVTVSIAMVLSFIESRIPAFVPIPGVKIGLANIAVIFALYRFGTKEAICISLVRVFLVSLLFGSFVSLLYSVSGALLSFGAMLLTKRMPRISHVGVSVIGGVCHNIGQIIVACFIMQTNVIVYYLPFLLLSGTIAGIAVGVLSALLISKVSFKMK